MNIKKQYKRKLHTIIHNDVKLNKYDLHIEYKLLKIIKFFYVILFLLTIYKIKMDISQTIEDNNNDNEILKNIKILMNMLNENSNILSVKKFFNFKQKREVITLNPNYNNTYSYFLIQKKGDFALFQTYLGNILRNGLTINEEKENEKNIKILKRGLPYIYEFTKIKRNETKLFKDELFSFLSELYLSNQIKTTFIYQYKILSEYCIQISFDLKYKNWIISLNKYETIIFENKEDLDQLKNYNKITDTIYEIANLWLDEVEKIPKELIISFIQLLSHVTLVGFYIGNPESILSKNENKYLTFSYIINNQENLNKFSLSREKTKSIFNKFNLNYENPILKKGKINSFLEIKVEIINLYNEISYNFVSKEYCGSIIIIQSEDKVISALKVKNIEMQAITYMKNQINNLPSTTELEPDIFINHIVKKFELPRESSIYLTILNNLLLPRNLLLKIQNIKFILDNDEMKKKIMSENNNIKKNQNNQNHSFSCSLDISTNSSIYSNNKNSNKVTLHSLKKKKQKILIMKIHFIKVYFQKLILSIIMKINIKRKLNLLIKLVMPLQLISL